MRRLVFIVLIGLILSCDTERNIPLLAEDTFLKFYGVEGEQTGVDFVLTADNALVMVGNSTQPGGMQMIYVVKVDLLGNVIWENMIGLADKNNTLKDIELHPDDGRLIIAGETEMAVGNRDVFVKILDGDGGELDSIRYVLDINGGGDEEVNSITVINNGFIVSGSTTDVDEPRTLNDTKDGLILRLTDSPLSAVSNPEWRSRGVLDSEDVVIKMVQLDANTYYGFGHSNTQRKGSRDFKYWIFSINDAGGELNNGVAFFDTLGLISEDERLMKLIDVNTPDLFDKGFLLAGIATNQSLGTSRPFFVKLERDLSFNPKVDLEKFYGISYGGILGTNVSGRMSGYFNLLNNDYLILATQYLNSNLAEDLSLFKLDREIQTVWGPEVFGGESFDEAGAVLQLPDGKIMVLGTMTVGGLNGQKKMALLKLNDKGKLLR